MYINDYSGYIGIIGGGIAGLTLGCALLKESIPVIVFEKSSDSLPYVTYSPTFLE